MERQPAIVRVLLCAGLVGPVFIFAGLILLAAITPEHDWIAQFASDLASDGARYESVARYGLFLPFSVLMFGFAVGVWLTYGSGHAKLASIALMFYSLLTALGVIYNCDAGCPADGGSSSQAIHNAATGFGVFALFLVPSFMSAHFRATASDHQMHGFTVCVIALAVIVLLLPLWASMENLAGLIQRAGLSVIAVWLFVLAVHSLRHLRTDLAGPWKEDVL